MSYKNRHGSQEQGFTPMKIFSSEERQGIIVQLKNLFGIKKVEGTMIMKGKEKVFLFTGDLDWKMLRELESKIIIERTGVYFGKISDDGIRLSIEGTNLLKDEISKNIFVLNPEQAEDWVKGRDLQIETGKRGFLVMKYGDDFLGCGKASEKKIGNFIPKSRRLRERG